MKVENQIEGNENVDQIDSNLKEEDKKKILKINKLKKKYQQEFKEKLKIRKVLLLPNKKPSEKYFSSLDSSIKRTGGYVKGFKNFNDISQEQKEKLVTDFQKLNLSRYISEIIEGITKKSFISKINHSNSGKKNDFHIFIQLICLFHKNYPNFSTNFISLLIRNSIFLKENNENETLNPNKRENNENREKSDEEINFFITKEKKENKTRKEQKKKHT